MALTSEELNYLLYRYLLESGVCVYAHTLLACVLARGVCHRAAVCQHAAKRTARSKGAGRKRLRTAAPAACSLPCGAKRGSILSCARVLKRRADAMRVPALSECASAACCAAGNAIACVLWCCARVGGVGTGYTHTAFTFANESLVKQSGINGADVPPGALISFVQKGMLYSNIEQHVNDDGTIMDDVDDDKLASLLLPGHVQARETDDKENDGGDGMDEDGMEVEASKITTLSGHENEVFTVAWNPVKSLLASGSGDSSARIWHIPTTESGPEAERNTQWHVLEHMNPSSNEKAKDVTTLDWNSEGSLLATGSYDGHARIWNEQVASLPVPLVAFALVVRAVRVVRVARRRPLADGRQACSCSREGVNADESQAHLLASLAGTPGVRARPAVTRAFVGVCGVGRESLS